MAEDTPESFQESLKKALRKNAKNGGSIKDQLAKLPPQAIELEEAVLGAIMLEKDAIYEVMDILRPESFYKNDHGDIYRAALDLFEKSQPIDILTMTEHLRSVGKLALVGGAYRLSELTNRTGSAANIQYHARIIQEKYILRELIRISSDITTKAFDPQNDVFELLDEAETALFNISEGNFKNQDQKMSTLIKMAIEQAEELKNREEGLTGIGSGFTALDRITSGWQRSDLIIIAARPAMGKTAFVLNIARNAAVEFDMPVALFSLEMSNLQLVNRLISAEAHIKSDKLRSGNLEDFELLQIHEKTKKLANAKLFIDDTPALNVFDLRAKARRLKDRHGIQMIIIDYLQLMSGGNEGKGGGGGGNREQEISKISRSLKGLAKDLNVPVIALSQLSRAVETRGGTKRPMLSDLRESGSIEQDADQVLFLYRGDYYGFTEDEEGNPTTGTGEVIIAKNRHGSTENVRLRFVQDYAKFTNLDEYTAFGAADVSVPDGVIKRASRFNDNDGGVDDVPF
ncbi:MAG: replicative DNA helicase [Bacteroidetes bacterium]|nr:replicative DNA helicase [Bacteroidota bacterium]